MEKHEKDQIPQQESDFSPSTKLNFIIGICAMLVSIASFYATYLQAESAEQQVKAMTYPLIEFSSGNYDLDLAENSIYMLISNKGVGPAIIKDVGYEYEGTRYHSFQEYLKACCDKEYKAFSSEETQKYATMESQLITSFPVGTILRADGRIRLATLRKRPENAPLWDVLNHERFNLKLDVCYCSLLDKCYKSKGKGDVVEVKQCPVNQSD